MRHICGQWLFPSPERSRFNSGSYPLTPAEGDAIAADAAASRRLLTSYKLILDFYGFEMVDEETGELRRKADPNFPGPPSALGHAARFRNLNTVGNHNFMRISRILHCLKACGLGRYTRPFLRILYHEAFVEGTLSACCESFARFWMRLVGEDWAAVAEAEFPKALALAQGGRVRREKRIKCDGCGALLLDGEAFQKHCAEVEHDDEFAFTCTEVVVEVK